MVPPPVTGSAPVSSPPSEMDAGSTTTPRGTTSVTTRSKAALTEAPVAFVTETVYPKRWVGSGVASVTALATDSRGSSTVAVAESVSLWRSNPKSAAVGVRPSVTFHAVWAVLTTARPATLTASSAIRPL